jgi:hypothetical protein
MILHRSPTKALIVLCLLALQVQLLASSTLACKHFRMLDGRTNAVCPYHGGHAAPRGADAVDGMLDCQKCVLALFFSAHHPMPLAPSLGLPLHSPIKAGSGIKHFYRFVPGRLFRPPILLPAEEPV